MEETKEGVPTMVCEEDNVAQFNAALKAHAPDAHALAAALYRGGMVSGLAGASIRSTAAAQERDRVTDDNRAVPVLGGASVERGLRQWYADAGLKYPHGRG